MRVTSKIAVLVTALALALSGLAYSDNPRTDKVVSSGSSEILPTATALYVTGQGPQYEQARYYRSYRPYYRTYGPYYIPYYRYYRYGYSPYSYKYRHYPYRYYGGNYRYYRW